MSIEVALTRVLTLTALVSALAACGEDGPTTPSSHPSSGAPLAEATDGPSISRTQGETLAAGSVATTVSVAEILGSPSSYFGQELDFLGTLVQPLTAASFLFTDGTGRIPFDFDPAGPMPPLNEAIQATGTVIQGTGDFPARVQVLSWNTQPPFDCDMLEEARGRFTDPGFVAGNVVGYFLAFRGLPPGEKTIEINWGDGRVDSAEIGQGRQRDDGLFDLEGVIGHEYQNLKGPEEKPVRASLYVEGRDGSCSRVRSVTVAPGSGPGTAAGGALRLKFNDPVPSGGFFSVSAFVRNPTSREIDATLVYTTPDRSSIRTMGSECQKVSDAVVECRIEGIAGNETGDTFVQYNVPLVAQPIVIRGSVTLVSRDFSPVANYSTTIEP